MPLATEAVGARPYSLYIAGMGQSDLELPRAEFRLWLVGIWRREQLTGLSEPCF